WKPIRKGTVHIIRKYNPVVVPIVIDGFRRSFDKKGIRVKKKGILQSIVIKEPMEFTEDESVESIIERLEMAIEQHSSFVKVIPREVLLEQEKLNEQRRYSYKE
ncbi:MAG: 1-acyl-sn-glycerol-3-phosphate acyltransferase, partial [Mesonia sp.]